jgi:hypothetical protein|tara:strand:+ start:521 stop:1576 length:1056 start_codon:yes stop_codon:yes gene_type:complete
MNNRELLRGLVSHWGGISKQTDVFDFYRLYNDHDFNGKKLIFTFHECSDALRIKTLLEILKSKYDMDKNDFILVDGNHNLSLDFVVDWDPYLYDPLGDRIGWQYYKNFLFQENDNKLKTNKFLCMNGSFQPHRVVLLNDLYINNCLEDSCYSNNFGGEEFYNWAKTQIKWDWNEIWEDVELEKDFWVGNKKKLDGVDDKNQQLLNPHIKYFEDSYFSVVTETWFNNKIPDNLVKKYPDPPLKITEKTYGGLLFHPFIVLGCPYTLRYLRGLGFKTFPEFFDESYDMIEDVRERYEAVLKNILELNKKSLEELKEMYDSVYDKILYNQRLFNDWDRDKLVSDLYEKIMEKSK